MQRKETTGNTLGIRKMVSRNDGAIVACLGFMIGGPVLTGLGTPVVWAATGLGGIAAIVIMELLRYSIRKTRKKNGIDAGNTLGIWKMVSSNDGVILSCLVYMLVSFFLFGPRIRIVLVVGLGGIAAIVIMELLRYSIRKTRKKKDNRGTAV